MKTSIGRNINIEIQSKGNLEKNIGSIFPPPFSYFSFNYDNGKFVNETLCRTFH